MPLDKAAPVRLKPDNHGVTCTVYLTPFSAAGDNEKLQLDLVSNVVYLLGHLSLRPSEEFMHLVSGHFERGLVHKVSSGRLYDETADLVGDEHYEELANLPSGRRGPTE